MKLVLGTKNENMTKEVVDELNLADSELQSETENTTMSDIQSGDAAIHNTDTIGVGSTDNEEEAEFRATHAELLHENLEARNENGTHFALNDGSTKAIYRTNAVRYFDKNEKTFKKIDNSLVDEGETLSTVANSFKSRFNKRLYGGRIFDMEKEGSKVSLNLEQHSENCTLKVCDYHSKNMSELLIENARNNTDIQYIVDSDRIKENIIIKEKSEEYIYNFSVNIENLDVGVSEDGECVELKNKETGKVSFIIPKPFMFDANDVYSDNVYYEIESVSDTILTLKVIADVDFINAEDRDFPVTIDPQIVSNAETLLTMRSEYRYVYSSSSSGGYSYSGWYNSGNNLRISQNSSMEYRSAITVLKSKLNISGQKIYKAVLKLKPYNVSNYGDCYLNGKYIEIANSNEVEIDITSNVRNNSGDFTIYLEPYFYGGSFNGYFYTSGTYAPVIEIEYITNEVTRPTKETFDLAGMAVAEFNLSAGEVVPCVPDVMPNGGLMGMGVSHIYKINSENFGCGKNFRLNLHEKFAGSVSGLDANYVYTDAMGEKHGFYEYFYYINSSDKKSYISKGSVTVESDGKLTYSNYEVFPEYRSATGLNAMPQLAGIKNVDIYEQRNDEHKQLEQQVEGYKNALLDYVKASTTLGTTDLTAFTATQLNKTSFDTYVNGVTSSQMLLPKAEGLQLKGLLIQKASLDANYTANQLDLGVTPIKQQLVATKLSMEELKKTLVAYIDNVKNSFTSGSSIKSALNSGVSISTIYINFVDDTIYYRFSSEEKQSMDGASLKSQCRQWNMLVNQYNLLSTELTNQSNLLDRQIEAIKAKKDNYLKQIKDYYKEYSYFSFKLEKLKKELPINYLSDGSIIKGFNADGRLVLIFDKYENYVGVEYEIVNNTQRIKQIIR